MSATAHSWGAKKTTAGHISGCLHSRMALTEKVNSWRSIYLALIHNMWWCGDVWPRKTYPSTCSYFQTAVHLSSNSIHLLSLSLPHSLINPTHLDELRKGGLCGPIHNKELDIHVLVLNKWGLPWTRVSNTAVGRHFAWREGGGGWPINKMYVVTFCIKKKRISLSQHSAGLKWGSGKTRKVYIASRRIFDEVHRIWFEWKDLLPFPKHCCGLGTQQTGSFGR